LVDVRTDEPERRFRAGTVLCAGPAAADTLTVAGSWPHGARMRVRFEGVADRTAADGLRGAELTVESDELPRSGDPDDFHDAELIGLTAVTLAGAELGVVTDVLHPAQDVLVVARADGAGEALVPFVAALVPRVDLAAGRLVVDAPPGLLDTEEG
ncbi:MAG: ribosome maturation factor RimM, partial [Pseudonocardiaceae bacterium]|nr:ribosome maturation factor RimM [Pseudonocardiaceae bacterium]